jgi:hypothetical protein
VELTKRDLVARANAVHEELGALPDDEARWQYVKSLVDTSDVFIGVWQDADYPNGVGTYIIKGDRLLRGVIANNKGQSVRFAAIPCECLEQAIALKQGAGETPAYD